MPLRATHYAVRVTLAPYRLTGIPAHRHTGLLRNMAFGAQIVCECRAPRLQLFEAGLHPLAVGEDRERRSPRFRTRLRRRDGRQLHVHAAHLEDRLGEEMP